MTPTMLDVVLAADDVASNAASNLPVIIAVIGAIGTIAATIVTQLFLRSKTQSEAGKATKEGDSALVDSASNFIAQTGEFGAKLMQRIAVLEEAILERDANIESLRTEVRDLRVELARGEALRETLADTRERLGAERTRREAAERAVSRLEAIIVAAQIPVDSGELPAEALERHERLRDYIEDEVEDT